MDDTVGQAFLLEPRAMPALPALPPELWLTIFEYFAASKTHIFEQSYRQRREATRNLQRLQFVCTSWRAMIRPLTYRNPALSCANDEAIAEIDKFARLVDEAQRSGSLKALDLGTFWIEKEPSSPPFFLEPSAGLLLRITNFRELVCNYTINDLIFASIARCHGSTLEKLSIRFPDHPLPAVLQPLNHLAALQDLHIQADRGIRVLGSLPPFDLPYLRLLEIQTSTADSDVLKWFAQSNLPMITKFGISFGNVGAGFTDLPAFMLKHGARLTTATFGTPPQSLSTFFTCMVFPHTPCLTVLGLDAFQLQVFPKGLPALPASVTQVVFRGFDANIGWTAHIIGVIYAGIQQLSQEHKLRSFLLASAILPTRNPPFLWHEKIQVADKRRVKVWKKLTQTTAMLLACGILVLDEQHMPLSDVLRDMDALPELESLESLHEESKSPD